MTTEHRILLSGPDVNETDRAALLAAFDSGWVAPAGPEIAGFEADLAEYVGTEACVALSSGTAALHLALLALGIGPGDDVVVQTATFGATAFAVCHAGATPVFCDIDTATLAIAPERLSELLAERARTGRLPKAVIPVDLYGSCADYGELEPICARYEIPLIEDAAEALGSIVGTKMAGSFGVCAILSFNGNKIITTSGGGALVGPAEIVDYCRYLSTQAREPVLHYEHRAIGYNYRLSNLLAALGRSQLAGLEAKIARRTEIAHTYRTAPDLAALTWPGMQATTRPNFWLNVAMLPEGADPSAVCERLDQLNIEARPAWAPMHGQPVFAGYETAGGEVADALFDRGICLPSGSGLSDDDVARVIDALADAVTRA